MLIPSDSVVVIDFQRNESNTTKHMKTSSMRSHLMLTTKWWK